MNEPFLSSRDKLAAVLHQAIRTTGPGIDCDRIADAVLASGVVVTPAVYLAGLADDEAMVERVARAINRGPFTLPGDRLFRIGQARDAIGTLADALATPTTEET